LAGNFAISDIGAFGSSYISRQWPTESYRTAGEYFYSGTVSIGFDAAGKILQEFWPDPKKRLRFWILMPAVALHRIFGIFRPFLK